MAAVTVLIQVRSIPSSNGSAFFSIGSSTYTEKEVTAGTAIDFYPGNYSSEYANNLWYITKGASTIAEASTDSTTNVYHYVVQ